MQLDWYRIIRCYNCGLIQYVKHTQKTRKCSKCNKTIDLSRVIEYTRTRNLQEAVSVVQQLKLKDKDIDTFGSAYDKLKDS